MSEEYNEAVRRYKATQPTRKPKMQIAFNPRRDHEALLDFMERAQELYGPIELKFVDKKEEERREAEWVQKKKRPQPREWEAPPQSEDTQPPQDKDCSKESEAKKQKQEDPLEEAAGTTGLQD